MNRLKTIFLAGAAFCLGACSYDDKTTYADIELAEIVIDTTGIPAEHVISREDTLRISPSVYCEGTSADKFEYEWRMTMLPGSDFTTAKVIGHDKDLVYEVMDRPDASAYRLWFRVKNTDTGLLQGILWNVKVEASSGQGLVVATTEDGQTTDFSIVQDTLFTSYYFDGDKPLPTRYRYDFFSKNNGKKLDGVVNWMFAQPRYYQQRETYMLHGASRHNIFRLNTMDYSVLLEGKDFFYDRNVELDVDYFTLSGPYPIISNKGRLYGMLPDQKSSSTVNRFGTALPGDYNCSGAVTADFYRMSWFQPETGEFWGLKTNRIEYTTEPPLRYDLGSYAEDLKGAEVLGCGVARSDYRFVVKKGDAVYVYLLRTPFFAPYRISKRYDISDAPGIGNATSIAFGGDREKIFYYVADNVVRAVVFNWDVEYMDVYDPGEEVSFIQLLKKTGKKKVPYDGKALLVATKGEGASKVHALTLVGSNTGQIESVSVFEGFKGEITAFAVQD